MDQEKDTSFEEQEESKGYRIVKNIFKGLLFGASALVWVLIFWLILSTREPSFYNEMIFSDRTKTAASAEDYKVWQVNVSTFMNYDNSFSTSRVWYAKDTSELEVGFRINTQKLLDRQDSEGATVTENFVYELLDEENNRYPVSNVVEEQIGRYHYYRVTFSGVDFDPSEGSAEQRPVLRLSLTRASDGEPLYLRKQDGITYNESEITILDSKTVLQEVDYDP